MFMALPSRCRVKSVQRSAERHPQVEGNAFKSGSRNGGAGIPRAESDRVFDRSDRRGLANEPGTGLGLAIVRGVAQRQGAQVQLAEPALGGLRSTLSSGRGTDPGPAA